MNAGMGEGALERFARKLRIAARSWKGPDVYEMFDARLPQQCDEFLDRPIAVTDGKDCRHLETRRRKNRVPGTKRWWQRTNCLD
jgi:hypothetical protein